MLLVVILLTNKPNHPMMMKKNVFISIIILMAMAFTTNVCAQDVQNKRTEETWDKVFPLSEKVNHR